MTVSLFALGTNQPVSGNDLASTLTYAIQLLGEEYKLSVKDVSPFYRTPAWPPGNGPDFLNAAATLESDLSATQILQIFHRVEADLGRLRPVRWAPRTLDLDLLAVGNQVLPDHATARHWMDMDPVEAGRTAPQTLILPHPRLHERAFVLIPLHDVAPGWIHPILGRSVREMAMDLPAEARREVIRLA